MSYYNIATVLVYKRLIDFTLKNLEVLYIVNYKFENITLLDLVSRYLN